MSGNVREKDKIVKALSLFSCTFFKIFTYIFVHFFVAPPVLTATPINTTVDEGKATVLRCSASFLGSRPVQVQWFKNGSPLTPSPDIRYHVAFTGHLIFSITRYSDRGLYKCVAQNKGGKASATAYLKVRGSVALKGKQKIGQ